MSGADKKPYDGASCSFLPEHSVRVSGRARRIGLRVLPGKGLEVVLPQNADPACVPLLLARHRAWIEKHLRRVREHPRGNGSGQEGDEDGCALPERMLLKGGLEEVIIRSSLPGSMRRTDMAAGQREPAPRLRTGRSAPARFSRELSLPGNSPAVLLHTLREWVREEARRYLGQMLDSLAVEHGFAYSGFGIRFQRSRWGSCSSKGNISLNACLLFLPEYLARHIVLHELCHTRQLNHSQAFWKQLFSVSPDALAHDRAMRGAWSYVPDWVFS